MGLRIQGLDRLNRKLEEVYRRAPEKFDRFLGIEGETLRGKAIDNTPVGATGDLRINWKKTDATGGQITVYNNVKYAAHVEYGHRQEVGRFVPAIGKRLKRPFVPGRHMLERAVDQVDASFEQDVGTIFEELLND